MSKSYRTLRSHKSSWWQRLFASPSGCHLLGISLSLSLIVSTALFWYRSNAAVTTVDWGDAVIDVADAAQLVSDAENWRQKHTLLFQDSQAIDSRVATIAKWLPPTADWDVTEKEIRTVAQSAGVNVVSLDEGGRHVGTRVGVAAATCRIDGSYQAICRFLVAIANRDQPIECHEIKMQRGQSPPAMLTRTHDAPPPFRCASRLPPKAASRLDFSHRRRTMQDESTGNQKDLTQRVGSKNASNAKKKVAVAVLSVVLVIAFLTQPDSSSPETESDQSTTVNVPESDSEQPPQPIGDQGEVATAQFSQIRELSRIDIDRVLESSAFVSEPKTIRRIDVADLKVQAVYGNGVAKSALVGSSIVRSGQPLPDGRKVLAVSPEGVELSQ